MEITEICPIGFVNAAAEAEGQRVHNTYVLPFVTSGLIFSALPPPA